MFELRVVSWRIPQDQLPDWEDRAHYAERLQFRYREPDGSWSAWKWAPSVVDDSDWQKSISAASTTPRHGHPE